MTAPLPSLSGVLGDALLAPGSVALVGGGPGALDLITVRGLHLLQQADVVVMDRLGPRGLTELLAPDVTVIDVGKTPGHPSRTQEQIGALLVEQAQAGLRVVRLKGGDPFLLGRGGEEVLACRAAGIEVQVVPGVTSAIAGPAAGDIPVTHRGAAVALHVVNAHGDLGPADLAALRDPGTTTVLMMGVGWLPRLVSQALLNGVAPDTPVAVVQSATLPEQRSVRGTLATIEEKVRESGIGYPAVITVGRTSAEGFLDAPSPAAPARGAGREALPAHEEADGDGTAVPVLIGCAHGTRLREGRDVVRAILRRIAEQLPSVAVREAYVDVQSPEVAEVVAQLAPACTTVRTREEDTPAAAVVVPLLLSTGFHVGEDIAGAVAGHEALAAGSLGPDPRLAEVMAQRLQEAGARPDDAVVMAVAGTRDRAGQAMAEQMGALLSAQLQREVTVGFIAAAQPSVADAVAQARQRTGARVAVATYLLAPGFFHTQLRLVGADLVAAPLGDHPLIAEIAVDRYRSVQGS
ncbi:uroporphyrinogen-III C-methyltransferase [uncultured Brachybacterium sp.]|uniref:uroporphyrinogen-III C-methyltransferase n=1 Tax=uncultured Brachybacterium sp. TaxID=189680 RepID=UPI00262E70BC|nr:uroporphyrinogen-III C-methyltransferase [uncultured Brachybacterium sp.]